MREIPINKETYSLNLDPTFNPIEVPALEYKTLTFPGGELHIRIDPREISKIQRVIITQRIRTSDDIMLIILAVNALMNLYVQKIELFIPYLPYARQDRVAIEGESFSLAAFANVLNALNLNTIYCLDAHSDIASKLICNLKSISNARFVKEALKNFKEMSLAIPDAGAAAKSAKLYKQVGTFNRAVFCAKKRDALSGKLTDFIVGAQDLKGAPYIIVDDICDGGGTFIGLAKALKEKNAGDLYLFVSHGIFSKGFEELNEVFKQIFTTNAYRDIDLKHVTQIPLSLK